MTQLKRLVAPKFWPIERKTKKYILPSKPGPHTSRSSIPLGVVLREVLKYAKTMKEADYILRKCFVKIDGLTRKNRNFGVGLMDIVEIGKDVYRVMPCASGFRFQKVSGDEAGFKLLRVSGKKTLRGKKIQVSFHDGRNIIVDKDDFKTGDVVIFELAKKFIRDKIKFDKGSMIFVIEGKNRGSLGKIEGITVTKSPKPNEVLIDMGSAKITLPKDYVFVIGHDKPVINLERNEIPLKSQKTLSSAETGD